MPLKINISSPSKSYFMSMKMPWYSPNPKIKHLWKWGQKSRNQWGEINRKKRLSILVGKQFVYMKWLTLWIRPTICNHNGKTEIWDSSTIWKIQIIRKEGKMFGNRQDYGGRDGIYIEIKKRWRDFSRQSDVWSDGKDRIGFSCQRLGLNTNRSLDQYSLKEPNVIDQKAHMTSSLWLFIEAKIGLSCTLVSYFLL